MRLGSVDKKWPESNKHQHKKVKSIKVKRVDSWEMKENSLRFCTEYISEKFALQSGECLAKLQTEMIRKCSSIPSACLAGFLYGWQAIISLVEKSTDDCFMLCQ